MPEKRNRKNAAQLLADLAPSAGTDLFGATPPSSPTASAMAETKIDQGLSVQNGANQRLAYAAKPGLFDDSLIPQPRPTARNKAPTSVTPAPVRSFAVLAPGGNLAITPKSSHTTAPPNGAPGLQTSETDNSAAATPTPTPAPFRAPTVMAASVATATNLTTTSSSAAPASSPSPSTSTSSSLPASSSAEAKKEPDLEVIYKQDAQKRHSNLLLCIALLFSPTLIVPALCYYRWYNVKHKEDVAKVEMMPTQKERLKTYEEAAKAPTLIDETMLLAPKVVQPLKPGQKTTYYMDRKAAERLHYLEKRSQSEYPWQARGLSFFSCSPLPPKETPKVFVDQSKESTDYLASKQASVELATQLRKRH